MYYWRSVRFNRLAFCVTVGIDRVVGKTDLVPFPGGVHNEVCLRQNGFYYRELVEDVDGIM